MWNEKEQLYKVHLNFVGFLWMADFGHFLKIFLLIY